MQCPKKSRNVERRIDSAVGVEPGDICVRLSAGERELAADKNGSIIWKRQTGDGTVRDGRRKGAIQSSIGAKARHGNARLAPDAQELPAEQDLAIILHREA